ncbi:MAG: hypothetical protein ACO37G_02335, partial [Candidatus Nanopelagicaceae bacterium]
MTKTALFRLMVTTCLAFLFSLNSEVVAIEKQRESNCVNIKTGKARLITDQKPKCKKSERRIKFVIPVIGDSELSIVHSGSEDPIVFEIGHDGDFYLNTSTNRFYGPRKNGLWGFPINLAGPAGPRGNTLLSGKGSPTIQDGLFGDFYLDLNDYKIYGPKNLETIWGDGISLVGPQGVTGTTGATGPQG